MTHLLLANRHPLPLFVSYADFEATRDGQGSGSSTGSSSKRGGATGVRKSSKHHVAATNRPRPLSESERRNLLVAQYGYNPALPQQNLEITQELEAIRSSRATVGCRCVLLRNDSDAVPLSAVTQCQFLPIGCGDTLSQCQLVL